MLLQVALFCFLWLSNIPPYTCIASSLSIPLMKFILLPCLGYCKQCCREHSVQFSSVAQSFPTLCNPMDHSTPSLSVHHQLPEPTQTQVHWVSDAIQPSHPVVPFSSCLQCFSASGTFPMSWLCPSGGQSIGDSALASVLPMNVQGWFHLGLTDLISLQSKGLSRVFSSTTVWKHQFFSAQSSLWSNVHPYMTTGKTIALTIQSFVSKMMSLLFNMLSVFIIAFLSRSKSLLISWLQSPLWFGSPRR